MPTFLKYWLIQLPGIVCCGGALLWAQLADWISPPWPYVLFFAWIAKDAALYPFLRDAYHHTEARHGPQAGQLGKVRKPLTPEGTVHLGGTLWNARHEDSTQVVEAGASVRVVESKGLLLVVSRNRTTPSA